ncbi:hypothetical protein GDO81_005318 [Engystomops pustulosus]|uniref:Uncharacterized protein n=1 Tax=Engystomops pustulosus TaxID=76066 RepID=A0AAV7CQ23_ENGPU|nr:hypothetical protein GDO81_005318 [Engystomops pustulosus]
MDLYLDYIRYSKKLLMVPHMKHTGVSKIKYCKVRWWHWNGPTLTHLAEKYTMSYLLVQWWLRMKRIFVFLFLVSLGNITPPHVNVRPNMATHLKCSIINM